SLSGYNGEMLDSATGWYLLGKGYRAYDPALMRFHSPDSLSPFGSGGLNPYTYCLGNPIALHDPTGHFASSTSSRTRIRHDDVGPEESRSGGNFPWMAAAIGAVMVAVSVAAVLRLGGAAFPARAAATPKTTAAVDASAAATVATAAESTAGASVAGGAATATTRGSTASVVSASASSTSSALPGNTLSSHASRIAGVQSADIPPSGVVGSTTSSSAAARYGSGRFFPQELNVQGLMRRLTNGFRRTSLPMPDAPSGRTSASSISDSLPDSLPVSRRSSVAESAAGSTGSAHPAIPENPADAAPDQTVRGQQDYYRYRGQAEKLF
ncbi:RHS repeat-associated core domain-containing protein, partial [Pseudomonas ovata]|uniref:RHS repeat-associated core domain-containing protein n=1 Tax=Pseudomonas ovata TaxID=1839709 RepID=UPI00137AE8B3